MKISLKKHFNQRFSDSEKAVQVALSSQKEASLKSEKALEERLSLLNELREGVATKEQLQSVQREVSGLSKLVYIGLGLLLALQFASQFLIK